MNQEKIEPRVGLFANEVGYSDVEPWEIIEITPKRVRVRRLTAKLKESFKPSFVVGGFGGHCVNSRAQEYDYTSDVENRECLLTFNVKKQRWMSKGVRFIIALEPCKYYDYNF